MSDIEEFLRRSRARIGDLASVIEQQDDRIEALEAAAREFLAATELLCDWMNGNDLSADHSSQKPEDYQRLCAAMERMQDALDKDAGK